MYRVAAYVAHVNNAHVDARQRVRSGHYVAYILTDETWYAFDDKVVKALASPPTSVLDRASGVHAPGGA